MTSLPDPSNPDTRGGNPRIFAGAIVVLALVLVGLLVWVFAGGG